MSFFGGGTDMEDYFKENGGAVLSTTFHKYCYVNVRHLPRFFDYSTELSYSKTERVTAVEDIQHIIAKLKTKNIGIIITDHNVHETLAITDRAYLLYEGRILESGTAEQLANNPEVRRKYLGQNFELRKAVLHSRE